MEVLLGTLVLQLGIMLGVAAVKEKPEPAPEVTIEATPQSPEQPSSTEKND